VGRQKGTPVPPDLAESLDALRYRLIGLREAANMSQRQLGRLMDVGQPYVSELERGVYTNPSIAVLSRWLRALGTDFTIK
jgi:transcriptional regulator with XRE-family HTH domain